MMHFFRRSKIHLDAFTYRRDVIEYAPVVNGINVIPNWWRELPKTSTNSENGFSPMATMKTCVGMYEYYAKSVAMPLWTDLCINVAENRTYEWQFSDFHTKAVIHDAKQYAGFLKGNEFGHIKIESPWLLSTKADIDWLMTDPVYNHKVHRDYLVAQGMLNFSKQTGANVQLFVDTSSPRTYMIPFGSLFLFTPLSDKKVVVHRQLITREEFDSKSALSTPITFINKYKNQRRIPKCPYKDSYK